MAELLPRYAVGDAIGSGGSSFVFAANETRLGREVALKVFVDSLDSEPSARERFAREARAMASLSHPNIVVIHDVGQTEELDWIAMERIEGATLRCVLQEGALDLDEFCGIAFPLLAGIEHAHAKGVVHRDIKPENVLIDVGGHVKVCDFGIAKWADPQTRWRTHSGVALGTPRYVAPEQIEAPRTVDQRADVFALGAVMYEMLTGEVPAGHFAAPSKRANCPAALDEVVLRAMSRNRAERQPTVAVLREELLEALADRPALVQSDRHSASESQNAADWIRSGWGNLAALLAVNAALLIDDAYRGDSFLAADPLWLFFLGVWLLQWLLTPKSNSQKDRRAAGWTRIAVGGCSVFFLFFWGMEHEHGLERGGVYLGYLLTMLSVAWLGLGIRELFKAGSSSRAVDGKPNDTVKAVKLAADNRKTLEFWRASGGWDWLLFLVTFSIYLPGLHDDGHLVGEAPIWLLVPVLALFQAATVSGALNLERTEKAAMARLLGGFFLELFLLMWAATDGVEDLEPSGRAIYGVLCIGALLSVVSGTDWWYRLHKRES